jgi:hypothetical protein
MWTRYEVRWEFMTDLCASVPANPDMLRKWLEARKPSVRPPDAKSIEDIAAEVAETILEPDEEAPSLLVFQRINGGLVMRASTIRAHIKDCASVLSSLYVGKIEREKSFSVKVKNAVYWPPDKYWIPILTQDGQPVTEASGVLERAIHVNTPMGQRSAIKHFEFVSDAVMVFPLLVMTQPSGKGVVSEADLKTIMTYGGVHGYGGERSLDGGRYVFTISQGQEE